MTIRDHSELRRRRTTTTNHNNTTTTTTQNNDSSNIDTVVNQAASAIQAPFQQPPPMEGYFDYFLLYATLFIIRSCLTHLWIHSYFDPDEFWQTLEPCYCAVFAFSNPYSCQGITWEWTVRDVVVTPSLLLSSSSSSSQIESSFLTIARQWIQQSYLAIGPIRSHLGLLPTVLFYWLLRYFQWDTTFLVSRGPLFLHITLITVPIDIATYYLVTILYPKSIENTTKLRLPSESSSSSSDSITTTTTTTRPAYGSWYLFITISSWFVAYSFTRTFANAYETLLFVLALVLVSPELFEVLPENDVVDVTNDSRTSINNGTIMTDKYRRTRTGLAFVLGGCSIAIRITAVASFVPLGILLALKQPLLIYDHSTKTHKNDCNKSSANAPFLSSRLIGVYQFTRFLFHPCASFGMVGVMIASCCDWYYNGFFSIPILSNLYFNVVMDYASLYGSHVWYWYYIHGLATISGLLYPILIYAFCYDAIQWTQWYLRSGNKSNQSLDRIPPILWNRLMIWILFASYIYVVSWNDHKEFRYISPALPLVFILCTPHVRDLFVTIGRSTTCDNKRNIFWFILGFVWIVANAIAVVYLGLFHQSGPITVKEAIVNSAKGRAFAAISSNINTTTAFSIHYLTGACHSTPLQSHLHIPEWYNTRNKIHFDTWHLNCHPSCRVEAKRTQGRIQCETDQFDTAPIPFLKRAYCVDGSNEDIPLEAARPCRPMPDYMVTFSHYLTEEVLDMLQYEPYCFQIVGRYPNHLRGLQIQGFGGKWYHLGEGHWSTHDDDDNNSTTVRQRNQHERMVYRYDSVWHGAVEVNWDAVVLLVRSSNDQCLRKQ
jgi:Alg9-like mannosyltransferase family